MMAINVQNGCNEVCRLQNALSIYQNICGTTEEGWYLPTFTPKLEVNYTKFSFLFEE